MQMNGTQDVRTVIKEALGLESSAHLVNGLTSSEMKVFLDRVVTKNRVIGRRVKYEWIRQGQNSTAKKPWSEKFLMSLFNKPGTYILLGSGTKTGGADEKVVKRITAVKGGEEARWAEWCSINKHRKSDHAIGLIVGINRESFLIDNGSRRKMIPFDILNIVNCLTHLTACYKFEIKEI